MTALTFAPLIDAGGGVLALAAMLALPALGAWLEHRHHLRSRR